VSCDPLKADYPHYTPYQYAGNKPINFIDLDGLEEASPKQNSSNNTNEDQTQIGNTQTRPSNTDSSDVDSIDAVIQLPQFEVVAERTKATLTVTEHRMEPTMWENFIGWINGVEESMRGSSYWSSGIEFNTNDGKGSNGQKPNPVGRENFDHVFTIYDWNEVDQILDILGITDKAPLKRHINIFKYSNLPRS